MPAVVSSGSGATLPVPGAGSAGARGAAAGAPGDFVATLATLLAPASTPVAGPPATAADLPAAQPAGTADGSPGTLVAGGLLAPDTHDGTDAPDTAEAPDSGTVDPDLALAQQVPQILLTVSPAASAPGVVAATAGDGQGVAVGGSASVAPLGAPTASILAPPTASGGVVDRGPVSAATTASTPAPPVASGPVPALDGTAPGTSGGASAQAPDASAAQVPASPVPGPMPSLAHAPSASVAVVVPQAGPAPRTTDPSAAPGAQPVAAVSAPAVPTTPVVTQAAPASPSAPATPQPFAEQLSRPVLRLAAGAPGEHVLTVRVSPEHLGPVTVQAHIGADGVRIELFSGSDAGRAAVQAALPDLRRDLAGTGLGASLDLSHRPHSGAPAHDPSAGEGRGDRGDTGGQGRDGSRADAPSRLVAAPGHHASTPSQPSPTVAVLDVLA
ncbi:flagellar hook-length control protein FliK [Intrasporangium flavum]|uniref:flagellar hook-length control protein FliK n=1 Tax=Intrasporangium flavum TaxID=1428657 RepID=UPI00096F7B31|nr:flagellar hook-length control protein FliK [Intrasporangium flavum]